MSKDRLRISKARTRVVSEALEAHKAAAFAAGARGGAAALRGLPFADGAPETDALQVSVEATQALLKHTESTGHRFKDAIRACAAAAATLSPRVPLPSSSGDAGAASLLLRLESCMELEADFAMETSRAAAAAEELEWTKGEVARARADTLSALEEVAAAQQGERDRQRLLLLWPLLSSATLTVYEHKRGSTSLAAALVDALPSAGRRGPFPFALQRPAPPRCSRTALVRGCDRRLSLNSYACTSPSLTPPCCRLSSSCRPPRGPRRRPRCFAGT